MCTLWLPLPEPALLPAEPAPAIMPRLEEEAMPLSSLAETSVPMPMPLAPLPTRPGSESREGSMRMPAEARMLLQGMGELL